MTEYRIVPVEPTEEMVDALGCLDPRGKALCAHIFVTMLAAAPSAADDEALVERVAVEMAERRIPGSTNDGGEYHESEGWRAVLHMDARAAISAIGASEIRTGEKP